MRMSKFRSGARALLLACFTIAIVFVSGARVAGTVATGTVGGRVVDPLGAVIPKARVTLVQREKVVGVTESDQEGNFVFSPVEAGQIPRPSGSARIRSAGKPTRASCAGSNPLHQSDAR